MRSLRGQPALLTSGEPPFALPSSAEPCDNLRDGEAACRDARASDARNGPGSKLRRGAVLTRRVLISRQGGTLGHHALSWRGASASPAERAWTVEAGAGRSRTRERPRAL